MAIAIFKLPISRRPIFPFILNSSQSRHLQTSVCSWASAAAAASTILVPDEANFIIKPIKSQTPGDEKMQQWKKLSSKKLGISTSQISGPTKVVLKELKKKGYEVYLVGGCVRDLILKRVPKDFDILTSAELREVIKTFRHAVIVGQRFPICHVHIGDHVIEVSSFSTGAKRSDKNLPLLLEKPIGCTEKDKIRWRNCMRRDFTINGLMFDPFARLVYDYTGGLEDIKKAKLRTIIPASISFQEDCARVLRGIRIAARLGFRLERETAQCVRTSSYTILRLGKGRFLMEMNYMLAYGSAEASLRLLWKFGLLEILLPHQAAYLVRSGFRRKDRGSNLLLALFANLDKLLAPDRPCDSSLWVMLLAFHMALSGKSRSPSVVAAFALAINNGGDIEEAVDIAIMISRPSEQKYHELLETQISEKTALKKELLNLAVSVNMALSSMTDEHAVSRAMAKYPQAPHSDLVIIPLGLYIRVCNILESVSKGRKHGFIKKGGKIDYDMLAIGRSSEVRHVFARVVFDTIYPLELNSTGRSVAEYMS
ncbi:uncharacterized protein LOC141652809 [Silene latifolia]|uniref:uncharacterized protein LOC141652809 n=1 Tax=Silene latifolia TaxID=37657 RepID=UPI003D778ABE